MTDRDTFAAAALTGLIANGDYSVESTPTLAWRMADAMLRERDKTSVGVSATGAESGSTPDAQGFGRSNECPCQPFDSAPTTDQERFVRFQSAVMNWISEATGFFHDDVLRTDDARDVITNACMRCWDAFDRIAYPTTNHDAVPEARADKPLSTGEPGGAQPQDGTGNTQEPVAWAIQWAGEDIDVRSVFCDRESAELHVANCHGKNSIIPLYRHPQPTLTDEERERLGGSNG